MKGICDGTINKSKEYLQIRKLKLEIKQEQNDMDAQFKLIGERIFQHFDLKDKEIQAMCHKIKEYEKRIRILRSELQFEDSELIECPTCKELCSGRRNFCSNCGSRLA